MEELDGLARMPSSLREAVDVLRDGEKAIMSTSELGEGVVCRIGPGGEGYRVVSLDGMERPRSTVPLCRR